MLDGLVANAGVSAPSELSLKINYIGTVALIEALPAPYNGIAEAEHIASVHAFLVSEGNARMTGQVLFVDGGFDALRRGDDIWQSV